MADVNSNLPVQDIADGTDGAAAPAIVQQIGGIDGSGNLQSMSVDTSGRPNINIVKTTLTGSSPTTATIGTSSATVIASNANRKGLIIVNTSTISKVSLHMAAGTAVLNSGITIMPGGAFNMGEYDFTTAGINGIAALASTVLSIQEFT